MSAEKKELAAAYKAIAQEVRQRFGSAPAPEGQGSAALQQLKARAIEVMSQATPRHHWQTDHGVVTYTTIELTTESGDRISFQYIKQKKGAARE